MVNEGFVDFPSRLDGKLLDMVGKDHKINTGMNTVRFLRIFFSFLGTPCWYEGIDKPTMYQRLWGWRIGPVMAWRLARITI